MKPAPFEYHAPTTVEEAVSLLAEHGDEAKALAGGQSLVPILALRLARFEHLVDLNRVDALRGVRTENGHVVVGAMTRQAALERDDVVARSVPLVAAALPHIGHFQIRTRGTIGGSIAHADPAAELPAVALALGASFEVVSSSRTRRVSADDFFLGTWMTAVEPDELLAAVRLPVWGERARVALREVARRAGDFALVGVAAAVDLDERDAVSRAGVALFGVGPTPVRARQAEVALVGASRGDVDADEVGRLAAADIAPSDDIHASASYRRRVTAHLVAEAMREVMAGA